MPNRNFRLLWSGQAVSELGSEISAIATPLVVLQLTGSTVAAGVIGSLVAVVELVGRLPGGLLADRLDRKRVMVCCDVLRALASAVVAVLLAVGHASVVALAAAAVIVAALSVLFNPAQAGLLGRIVPVEQRRAAVGRNAVRTNLAIAIGPPVGGLLVGLGPALAFGADALTFAVSGVLVALIAYPRYRTAPADRSPDAGAARRLTGDLTAGLWWVLRRRELLALLVLIAYLNLLGRAVELLSTFRLGDGGAAGVHAGFALTAAGLGGVAGGLCTAWILDRCRDATIVLVTTGTWAVLTVVLAAAPEWTIAPALFAMVFTLPPVSSLLAVAVLTDAPDEGRGRVSAALSLLAATLTWAGPLLTGWLTAVGGTALCGVVLAVPLVVGAAVVWWCGGRSAGGDAPPATTGEVALEQIDGGGAARERVDSAG